MSAAGLPAGAVIAIVVGVIVLAVFASLYAMSRTSIERRQRFGRLLGKVFIVVAAIGTIGAMVVPFFR